MSATSPTQRVTIVAARHREAVALLAAEGAGAELTVLCVEEDGKDGRAALDRALATARRELGGSTTMVVDGRLRNRPRSAEGALVRERAVADALVVVAR
ncbi:hypothetical protein PUR34_33260 [Streptomyces sp. JV185]|uniref:hypothetical protein n=1 Tax=Streptomyces sp. JV185 TaxID=858638 RepID=UPI002E75F0DC|nr:hypothetical protein [Streptomyces sp. JV185]MEE1772900.1 hypothetical protein [Streptomyces sp. JV185]